MSSDPEKQSWRTGYGDGPPLRFYRGFVDGGAFFAVFRVWDFAADFFLWAGFFLVDVADSLLPDVTRLE
jgi:hypothetical protein